MCEPESLIPRLLDVIEQDIVPKTRAGVAAGNELFGAAILHKSDLRLVLAETSNETENPLWHGELLAVTRFYELDRTIRPHARDCVFVSSHEPCALCLSAIAHSGFDNFFYLFSREEGRARAHVSYDQRVMRELFGLPSPTYHVQNAYWNSYSLRAAVDTTPDPRRLPLVAHIERLQGLYGELSSRRGQPRAG